MQRKTCATSAVLFVLCLAIQADAADGTPKEAGSWSTFWTAARDALTGAPSAKALAIHRHFEEAGLAFEYPAPLHMTSGTSGAEWTMTYGDFDLEVHAPEGSASASDYIGALAEMLSTELAKPEWLEGVPVTWCGRKIVPSHLRITLFDDRHDMRGYDMPAPEGQVRFVIFDDVLDGGKYSAVSEATYAAFSGSIRCKTVEKGPTPAVSRQVGQ